VFRDIHAAMTSDTARGKCRTTAQLAAAGLNGSAGEWAWDGALGTWYCVDPAEDLTAVFMIQRTPGGYDDLCRRFAQTVYGAIDD
jgi:CubicO group peptidase (beta-lactamase class C family)